MTNVFLLCACSCAFSSRLVYANKVKFKTEPKEKKNTSENLFDTLDIYASLLFSFWRSGQREIHSSCASQNEQANKDWLRKWIKRDKRTHIDLRWREITRVIWGIFVVQDVLQFHDTTPRRSNRKGFDCTRRHRSPQVRLWICHGLLHRICTREGFRETQTVFCHFKWWLGLEAFVAGWSAWVRKEAAKICLLSS